MFLPTFAMEASIKKYFGYYKVMISMKIETFKASIDINLHFFMSSSKLVPYLPAKSMPPS